MRELLKVIRQFVNGSHPRKAWEWLTTSGLLLRELTAAVRDGLSPDGLAGLEECCREVESDAFHRQILICYPQESSDSIDTDRLHHNFLGLLQTAQAAIAARHLPMAGALPELLTRSTLAAARCLCHGPQPAIEPEWPAHHLGGLKDLDVIEQVFRGLAGMGWEGTAARLWTLHWLTDGFSQKPDVLPQERVEVPFAAWVESHQTGRLVWLHLYRLRDSGPLVEHPGNALRALGKNWMLAVKNAWERSGQPGVCWNASLHSPEKPPPLPFFGDSAAGAVNVAFSVLGGDLAYDPRCLIVAGVRADGVLESVTREKEKIQAALREGGVRLAVVALGGESVQGTQLSPEDVNGFARSGVVVERLPTLSAAINRMNGRNRPALLAGNRSVNRE